MAIQVDGATYFETREVLQAVGVTRQTLWRWRQQGHVPAGNRFRDRSLLYSESEVEQIKQFANRVEPILSIP